MVVVFDARQKPHGSLSMLDIALTNINSFTKMYIANNIMDKIKLYFSTPYVAS